MSDLRSSYAKLQAQLQVLRPLLASGSWLDLFDEFIEHREYGLALHVVCDFILETDSTLVNSSAVDQIRSLHTLMQIDDDCVGKLQNTKPA